MVKKMGLKVAAVGYGEGVRDFFYCDGDDDIYREERRGVIRVFFFLSSLDFFSLKTSSSSPTLEILAQLNNFRNNILHNYYFWTVFIAKHVKPELRHLLFSFLFY